MNKKYVIYNGDCFEIMQNLIDKGISVDAIICDPPIRNKLYQMG